MTPEERKRRDRFLELAARYNKLGEQLPDEDAITSKEAGALDLARMLVAEMDKLKVEMDRMLFGPKRSRDVQ